MGWADVQLSGVLWLAGQEDQPVAMEEDRHNTIRYWRDVKSLYYITLSAENQKGANAVQRCSVENQKSAIAIDFVQQ